MESTVEAEAKAMLAVEMQGVPGVPRLLGYKKKLVRGKDAILMELIEGYVWNIYKLFIVRDVASNLGLPVEAEGNFAHSMHIYWSGGEGGVEVYHDEPLRRKMLMDAQTLPVSAHCCTVDPP